MSFRRYLLMTCTIFSLFLFSSGIYILSANVTVSDDEGEKIKKKFIEIMNKDEKPINVLLLGGDRAGKNTDTMIVAHFDRKNSSVSFLSIPRDTRITVKGSYLPKINSAYAAGGGDLAKEVVEELTGLEIDYYAFINLNSFSEIIDILGGVEYYIPADMYYYDPTQNLLIDLKQGQQTLDGKKAEQFMRFRQPLSSHNSSNLSKLYDGSDIKRISAQQNFLKEIIRQKMNAKYLVRTKSIIQTAFDNIETDMELNDIITLAPEVVKVNYYDIDMHVVPGNAKLIREIWYYECDYPELHTLINNNFKNNDE